MLFDMNSIQIKKQSVPGLEAPTARRTSPPLKANAHGDLARSCCVPHMFGEPILRMRVDVWAELMRGHFPVGKFTDSQNPVSRNFVPFRHGCRADIQKGSKLHGLVIHFQLFDGLTHGRYFNHRFTPCVNYQLIHILINMVEN
jgi:hypothetical protein